MKRALYGILLSAAMLTGFVAPAEAQVTVVDVGPKADASPLPPVSPDDVKPGEELKTGAELLKQLRGREYFAAFGLFLMLMVAAFRRASSRSQRIKSWLTNKWILFGVSVAMIAPVEIGTALAAGEKVTFVSAVGSVLAAVMVAAGAHDWGKKAKRD